MSKATLLWLHQRWLDLQEKDELASSYSCEVSHDEYDELIKDLFKALQEVSVKAWKYDELCK